MIKFACDEKKTLLQASLQFTIKHTEHWLIKLLSTSRAIRHTHTHTLGKLAELSAEQSSRSEPGPTLNRRADESG